MQKLPLAQQGDHSARQDPLNTDSHKPQKKKKVMQKLHPA